jgi:hypothetical protein
MDVYYQLEHQTRVQVVADVNSSLNDTYFLLNSAKNVTQFYVWFNVDGAGTDPAIAGKTGIEVEILENATALQVAQALQVAINANANFESKVVVGEPVVYITNILVGETMLVQDGAVETGFIFTVCQRGKDLYLGAIDGDFALGREVSFEDVTTHQTGVTPVTRLFQGLNASVELTLLETDTEKLKAMLDDGSGAEFTPIGGTKILGGGLANIGKSLLPGAARLLLHPVNLPLTDTSRDWVFWKAIPNLSEINFSGETKQTLSVEFTTFRDASKPVEVQIYAYHTDWKQLLPQA